MGQAKKFVSVLLCFSLGIAVGFPYADTASAQTARQNLYYGDLNGDGQITATDLSTLNQAVSGRISLTSDEKKRADLNGDGNITNADVGLMQQYIQRDIMQFPVESQLASISISSQPDRLSYTLFDAIDFSGMVVTAYYNNGTSRAVKDYRLASGNTTKVGRQQVQISYTESGITKSASFYIQVSEKQEEKKTLTYHANGGSGAPGAQTAAVGSIVKISTATPQIYYTVVFNANGGSVSPGQMNVKAGFAGWSVSKSSTGATYLPGSDFKLSENTVLYAQYEKAVLGSLPTPAKEGYTFKGWYSGSLRISAGTKITGSGQLTARWEKNTKPGTDTGTETQKPDTNGSQDDSHKDNQQGNTGSEGDNQQGDTRPGSSQQPSGGEANGNGQGGTGTGSNGQGSTGTGSNGQGSAGAGSNGQGNAGTDKNPQGNTGTGTSQQNYSSSTGQDDWLYPGTEDNSAWYPDTELGGTDSPDAVSGDSDASFGSQAGMDFGQDGISDTEIGFGDLGQDNAETGQQIGSELDGMLPDGKDSGNQADNNGSKNQNNPVDDSQLADSEDGGTEKDDGFYNVEWNVSSAVLQKGKSTVAVVAYVTGEDEIIRYESSDSSVATVNAKGKIKAKKIGTAVITVKTRRGCVAKVRIKVQKKAVTTKKLTVSKKKVSLKAGKTFELDAEVTPVTSSQGIKYMSSDSKVAAVSRNGRVKAKKKGTAVIKVKSGKKVIKVKIKVT